MFTRFLKKVRSKKAVFGVLSGVFGFLICPPVSLAHEAYVLTKEQFTQGLRHSGLDAFGALDNPNNLKIFLTVTVAVLIVLGIYFRFRHSNTGVAFDKKLKRMNSAAPIIVRLAIGLSFFYSALTGSFLGPEIPLANLPSSEVLRIALFIVSGMFFLGLYTEVAAFVSLMIFLLSVYVNHLYMATYLNYLGEIIVLALFGSRFLSFDRILRGPLKRFPSLREYDGTIVRIGYGIALSYAAITVKLLYPTLTVTVVKEYNLTQFHWLFPSDPLLVTLGAALAELAIGMFIIFGFETRLVVFIPLFYITLSLLYFKEVVWPHLMLYGISLNLLINGGGKLTLDSLFDKLLKIRK